jgi:hypothetical protein
MTDARPYSDEELEQFKAWNEIYKGTPIDTSDTVNRFLATVDARNARIAELEAMINGPLQHCRHATLQSSLDEAVGLLKKSEEFLGHKGHFENGCKCMTCKEAKDLAENINAFLASHQAGKGLSKPAVLSTDWCECSVPELLCYPEDNQCPCGILKHHVHCVCGKISQVG